MGLSLAGMVAFVDFTIVNTVLPSIQGALEVSFVELQWVMNAFVLALCVFMVNMGRFGDIFGKRLMLYIGLVLFGAASMLCGIAENGIFLIIFRAVQGLGVAMLIPSSLALVAVIFPAEERGKAIGIWTGVSGLGMAIGPVLGGIITSLLSWRWVFFVNVPILIIAGFIGMVSIREIQHQGDKTIDWAGFFLMIVGLGTLVAGVIQGPVWGWRSPITTSFFTVAVISLITFYIVESKVKSPIIDFKLFANSGFLSGAFANYTLISFAYASFFLMPLYLGNIKNIDPFQIGLLLLPITALIIIVAPIAGKLVDSMGAKLPILIGLLSLGISAIIQFTFKSNSTLIYIMLAFIFLGIGWGLIYGSGAFAAISALPKELAGTATGALWTFQNLGGSIGLAIAGVIFKYREKLSLDKGLSEANINLTGHEGSLIKSLLSDPDKAKQTLSQFTTTGADKILPIFEGSFMNGYSGAFLFLFGLAVLTFILIAFMMKNIKRVK